MSRATLTRSALIHRWTVGHGDKTETFRLISIANFTPGYEDRYAIEKLGQDGLGEPRWDTVADWKPTVDRAETETMLVDAIKSLQRGA